MNHRNGEPASTAAAAAAWGGALLFVLSLAYFLYSYGVTYGRATAAGPVLGPVLTNAGLFSLFALHHSVFARTRFKEWVRATASPLMERSIYTWISSALFIIVCALWQPVPGELYRLEGLWAWPGQALQAVGLLVTIVGARSLDVLDLAGIRSILRSRGQAPREPRLVTTGVFAIVRHPLYFGWVLLVFGDPHMTATRAVFAGVSTAYLALAIPWEERGLDTTFGAAYAAYRKRVRWRMLPGLH